jgi:hypothetical protein
VIPACFNTPFAVPGEDLLIYGKAPLGDRAEPNLMIAAAGPLEVAAPVLEESPLAWA